MSNKTDQLTQSETNQSYRFGDYEFDAAERVLRRDGEIVSLSLKPLEVLLVLLERRGRVVSKEELIERVWPDSFVDEANLARHVYTLRRTLGESPRENGGEDHFIQTVSGRGYRFIAEVKMPDETRPDLQRSMVTATEEAAPPQGESAMAPAQAPVRHEAPREAEMGLKLGRSKWIASAIILGVVSMALALSHFLMSGKTGAPATERPRTIAVLPFKPLEPNNRDEAFELGMADALITKLGGLKQLVVRPTGAIRKYSSLDQDPVAAGREQRVEVVLEGSLYRAGEKVRVTARLLDAKDGSSLWSYQSDEYFTDVLTAQDIISEKIAKALALKLTGVEQTRLAKRYTENTKAHYAYSRGRYFWNKRNREYFEKAIGYFKQAIAIDPKYALAYAGLADCYLSMTTYGMTPTAEEGFSKTKEAAKKALAIDDTLAEAHTTLAHLTWIHEWNWDDGERGFIRAIELNPNYSTAHQWYAIYLTSMGRHEKAIAEITRAQELDPISIAIGVDMARTFYFAGNYDRAIEECLLALDLDPGFYRIIGDWLEMAYERKGLYNEALEAQIKAMSARGARPETMSALKAAFAASGWKGYLQKRLELMKAEAGNRPLPTYSTANLYARLGDNDRALEWLHKAYDRHSNYLVFLKVDPMFDGLRADRRFTDLLRNVGLPQ